MFNFRKQKSPYTTTVIAAVTAAAVDAQKFRADALAEAAKIIADANKIKEVIASKPSEGTFRIKVNGKVIYEGRSGSVKVEQDNNGTINVSNIRSSSSISIVNGITSSSSNGVEVVIEGDVHGSVDAGMSVTCGNIGGDVDAGMNVTCNDVAGDIDAGMNVNASVIKGDVDAGMTVNVGSLG